MNDTPRTLDCGRTIQELSDYLAADRIPYDPRIETCPECLNALQGLARVSSLSQELIADDLDRLPAPPAAWVQGIMDNIHNEVRSGRSLPLPHPDPRVLLSVTEGAVRALIRSVGDDVPGVIIGKCDIEGEAEVAGAPIDVRVTASVAWGYAMPAAIAAVRDSVRQALLVHTQLNVGAVNVSVEDIHGYSDGLERVPEDSLEEGS